MEYHKIIPDKSTIQIDINSILRLFNTDEAHKEYYLDLIKKINKEIYEVITPRIFLAITKDEKVFFEKEYFKIGDNQFDAGKIINSQINKSDRILFFILTIGNEIENIIKYFNDINEPLSSYIADQLASEYTESTADLLDSIIMKNFLFEGEKVTNRYSPGYCEWETSEQTKLFSNFPENYCDVVLNENCMMYPIKSVSGVIGIGKNVKKKNYQCKICDLEDCYKRLVK